MTSLLVDNIVLLTGVMTKAYYPAVRIVGVNQWTLSIISMVLCKLKLNYTMTSVISELLDILSLYSREKADDVHICTFLALARRYVLENQKQLHALNK
jgi:hypothetical protein